MVQDFRSILLQETHLSVFTVVFSQDRLLLFLPLGLLGSVFGQKLRIKAQSLSTPM